MSNSPVCPQLVPVSTGSAITVQTQMVAVKWTLASRVSLVASAIAGRRPVAFRLSSVTPTQTATSAREPPGEFTCIHFTDKLRGPEICRSTVSSDPSYIDPGRIREAKCCLKLLVLKSTYLFQDSVSVIILTNVWTQEGG